MRFAALASFAALLLTVTPALADGLWGLDTRTDELLSREVSTRSYSDEVYDLSARDLTRSNAIRRPPKGKRDLESLEVRDVYELYDLFARDVGATGLHRSNAFRRPKGKRELESRDYDLHRSNAIRRPPKGKRDLESLEVRDVDELYDLSARAMSQLHRSNAIRRPKGKRDDLSARDMSQLHRSNAIRRPKGKRDDLSARDMSQLHRSNAIRRPKGKRDLDVRESYDDLE